MMLLNWIIPQNLTFIQNTKRNFISILTNLHKEVALNGIAWLSSTDIVKVISTPIQLLLCITRQVIWSNIKGSKRHTNS